MPYKKTTWVNEILDGAERFDIKDNTGTPIHKNVQIVLRTPVITPGTPVDADNLNKIEEGIYRVTQAVERVTQAVESAREDTLVVLKVFAADEPWSTGDGKIYFTIPPELNGARLIAAHAYCYTASSSGWLVLQLARGRRASPKAAPTYNDMLSTRIVIDAGEYSSTDASIKPVINTAYAYVATRDLIRVDVDVAGTGTKGLDVSLVFRK